jgi:hypothetical protein
MTLAVDSLADDNLQFVLARPLRICDRSFGPLNGFLDIETVKVDCAVRRVLVVFCLSGCESGSQVREGLAVEDPVTSLIV